MKSPHLVPIVGAAIMTFFFFASCKKEETKKESTVPVLAATNVVTNITETTAVSGGKVISDGGSAVTARGVCYGNNQEPNIYNSKTENGAGVGDFGSSLSGLESNKKYYVRSYATNSTGTGYGYQTSFTTSITYGSMTDQEGNTYKTIQIGTQVWMAENLKTSKYRDGSAIPTGLSDSAWYNANTGAYAIYNNEAVNNTTYGKLYNWLAVTDSRKLCPVGWHVPGSGDWTTLETYLGGPYFAAAKMAAVSNLWQPKNNGDTFGGTNESGFSGLPGGDRNFTGTYFSIGNSAAWWSSTEYVHRNAWYFMGSGFGHFYPTALTYNDRNLGLSVRCIRD
jgi:uncharacterized protein (TIGR02145 family)